MAYAPCIATSVMHALQEALWEIEKYQITPSVKLVGYEVHDESG